MIESVNNLEEVLEPYAGQVVYNEKDNKVYRWDPVAGWELFKFEGGDLKLSTYELNQQLIGQLQILDEQTLQEKKELIGNFCDKTKNEYYMLLCRDINYYTLFRLDLKLAEEPVGEAVIDCAKQIGDIKAIDPTEDGEAIELWMTYGENTYVAYFFPYDLGVVVCG